MHGEPPREHRTARGRIRQVATLVLLVVIALGPSTSAFGSTVGAAKVRTLMINSTEHLPSVTLSRGEHLVVTMETTYWQIHRPSGRAIRSFGAPVTHRMINCQHLVGSGCGTVVETFVAIASGLSVISANRTSCGEAIRCSLDNATWRAMVHVR